MNIYKPHILLSETSYQYVRHVNYLKHKQFNFDCFGITFCLYNVFVQISTDKRKIRISFGFLLHKTSSIIKCLLFFNMLLDEKSCLFDIVALVLY